jgi:hypothetical protein
VNAPVAWAGVAPTTNRENAFHAADTFGGAFRRSENLEAVTAELSIGLPDASQHQLHQLARLHNRDIPSQIAQKEY